MSTARVFRKFFHRPFALMSGLALFTLLSAAVPCAALDLAVDASYWDAQNADATWGVGAKVGMPLIFDAFKIEGRAYWFEGDGGYNLGDVQLVPVDLGLAIHFLPHDDINPYVTAGASYVFADSTRMTLDGDFGAYAGGGVDFKLAGPFYLTAEALVRFVDLKTEDRWDTKNWDANGLTVNAGLMLRL